MATLDSFQPQVLPNNNQKPRLKSFRQITFRAAIRRIRLGLGSKQIEQVESGRARYINVGVSMISIRKQAYTNALQSILNISTQTRVPPMISPSSQIDRKSAVWIYS
uniref:Uncharacterized protein n=1 Tax=Spongospora subterranea TaxID=70186 RepID=A0A0H5REA6_9EUKA|eukprot:CRZ12333.1 hypothetical protein [Spongospora subterranea]